MQLLWFVLSEVLGQNKSNGLTLLEVLSMCLGRKQMPTGPNQGLCEQFKRVMKCLRSPGVGDLPSKIHYFHLSHFR